jgi:hypothetical protein
MPAPRSVERAPHGPPPFAASWYSQPGRHHSFRTTGITNYLKNGGKLELAQ